MSLSRVKTWAEETLTYSDLNAEFNNILNNARDLISPATGSWDINGYEFILDADADTSITADTDDQIDFKLNGADEFQMTTTAFSPSTSDGSALGTSSLMWADLFLASGSVINFNNGDVTLTHSANTLALAGASSGYTFDTIVYVNDSANANMTTGLTLNQGAADNEILAFKSSDVAHGGTGFAETDTYGKISKVSATLGGLDIQGLSEAGTTAAAVRIYGVAAANIDTTKSTAGVGAVTIFASQISAGTNGNVVADGNIFVIGGYTGAAATSRFIFDIEGSFHADVESTTFDDHDDVALIEAMDREFQRRNGDPVKAEYMEHLREHRDTLQKLGIVNYYDESGKRAMVNITKQAMLHNGAIRQLGKSVARLEQRLLALGVE